MSRSLPRTGSVLTASAGVSRLRAPTVNRADQGVRQLRIPTGVWHMNVNIGDHEAFLINHPTAVYHHEAPDRLLLPWDTDQLPVDLADYFPVQHRARGGRRA